MPERLTESQIKTAKKASKGLEDAWRVYSHPNDHSFEAVRDAASFIVSQSTNFKMLESLMESPTEIEMLDQVFMGLFHYPKFSHPTEFKYKTPNN